MNIEPLEILKWIGIVLAAGFVGYFGRYLAMLIIDRMHRRTPHPTPPAETPPAQNKSLESSKLKLEKKKAKLKSKKTKKKQKK